MKKAKISIEGTPSTQAKASEFSTLSIVDESEEYLTLNKKPDRQAKAKEFIKKVYDRFPPSPMNPKQHIMTWGEGDDMEFAIFELAPRSFPADTVEINWIAAYPQGKKVGERAINLLQDLAKQDGISLSLYPWDKIWNPELEEAEEGTEESKLIVNSLKKAGYKMLGTGADATVWVKEQGTVTKIIMPDIRKGSAEYRNMGAAIFKKFFDFCSQHQDIECLPKFYPVEGQRYLEFELGGKNYIQTDMEQLYPIRKNTFAEGMAYALSELVDQNLSWEELYELLKVPSTWNKLKMQGYASRFVLKAMSLSRIEQARYSVLFTMMKFLYITGRINRFGWDLHTENIMQRKDGTLVITDPWFEIQKDS